MGRRREEPNGFIISFNGYIIPRGRINILWILRLRGVIGGDWEEKREGYIKSRDKERRDRENNMGERRILEKDESWTKLYRERKRGEKEKGREGGERHRKSEG